MGSFFEVANPKHIENYVFAHIASKSPLPTRRSGCERRFRHTINAFLIDCHFLFGGHLSKFPTHDGITICRIYAQSQKGCLLTPPFAGTAEDSRICHCECKREWGKENILVSVKYLNTSRLSPIAYSSNTQYCVAYTKHATENKCVYLKCTIQSVKYVLVGDYFILW